MIPEIQFFNNFYDKKKSKQTSINVRGLIFHCQFQHSKKYSPCCFYIHIHTLLRQNKPCVSEAVRYVMKRKIICIIMLFLREKGKIYEEG